MDFKKDNTWKISETPPEKTGVYSVKVIEEYKAFYDASVKRWFVYKDTGNIENASVIYWK